MDFSHIVTDSGVCSGKPRVRGTLLTVELLQGLRAIGWSRENILETYPYLTTEQLNQALNAVSA